MRFRSLALVCAALALLSLTTHARAGDKVSKETVESGGHKRTYYLFAPASLKPQAPLVVLLHGSGRDGLSLVEKWKDLAAREGFLIAGPNARDSQGWHIPDDGPDFIRDVVEALRAKYPLDARRVYLFGHSAGAVFALHLAMMESEYFAAAAVHAGAWREEKEFNSLEQAKRKTSLKIIVGDRDSFFPLDAVRATEAALEAHGHEIEVKVMPGHDHWYYDLAPDINRDAWDFLKGKALDADPQYTAHVADTAARDFNSAINEINALRAKGAESLRLYNAGDEERRAKQRQDDAQGATAALRAQAETAAAGAKAFRDAALAAERAGASKVPEDFRQFFSLVARACAKRAEGFDVLKARAELQLAGGPPDETQTKVNEATLKCQKLFDEAEELEQQAERAHPGQGP
ncbi:MAG: prolyl oligopeptidase family serine peptidase [Acidobacteria bacterium]|nr:prolyl oligopeptidase family serine peptidase [Acidobacteriota bacterium]